MPLAVLKLFKLCGSTDDEVGFIRLILSNNKLHVRVNQAISEKFQSLLGAYQRDCVSECLFTLVLACAFNELRWTVAVDLERTISPFLLLVFH